MRACSPQVVVPQNDGMSEETGRLERPERLYGRRTLRDVSRPPFATRLAQWMGWSSAVFLLLVCPLAGAAVQSPLGWVGLVLAVVVVVTSVVRALRRVRWRHRRSGRRPGPWMLARRWGPDGVRKGRAGSLRPPLVATAIGFVVAAWFDDGSGTQPSVWAAAGLPVIWFAWRSLQVSSAGWTEIDFGDFPMRNDRPVRLVFHVSPRGAAFSNIRFELRRVEDRSPAGTEDGPLLLVYRAVHAPEDHYAPEPGSGLEVEFEAPVGERGTREGGARRTFWELWVTGDTSAGRFEELFPLPIYSAERVRHYEADHEPVAGASGPRLVAESGSGGVG